MDLTEYDQVLRTKALIYGPPFTGKTALVGQLAEVFTLHWFDLEHGVRTLLRPDIVKPEWRKNIKVFNVPDHMEYPIAIDTVSAVLKGGLKKICQAHGAISCPICAKDQAARWGEIDIMKFTEKDILVIDSGTQLARSAINKAARAGIAKQGAEYKMQRDDFGNQGRYMDLIFNRVQVLPINVAVISHEMDTEKDPEKPERIAPVGGTANYSKTVAKNFDELIYSYITQNGKHKVSNKTGFRPGVQSGSRSSVVLDNMEVPSLVPIFDPTRFDEFNSRKAATK